VDQGVIVLISFVVAFAMSWLVQPHFRNLGFLTKIVDHPGYRRPHRETVPRTGGMAIFTSFFCALIFLEKIVLKTQLPWHWLGILIGAGLAILALGVADDRFGIHAEKKLYGQLVVIIGLMLFGQRMDSIVLPLVGQINLGGWAWPFTLFWYLGFINSMNLIDGLDGLASGISVVGAVTLVVISMAVGEFFFAAVFVNPLWNNSGFFLLEYQQAKNISRRLGQYVDGISHRQFVSESKQGSWYIVANFVGTNDCPDLGYRYNNYPSLPESNFDFSSR